MLCSEVPVFEMVSFYMLFLVPQWLSCLFFKFLKPSIGALSRALSYTSFTYPGGPRSQKACTVMRALGVQTHISRNARWLLARAGGTV